MFASKESLHSSNNSVDLITFTITSASLENKLLLEPKPSCLCCSWLDPEYLQSVTALFPQGSVPFESNFSHVELFKSSHSKFQPTYANLLRWNITHNSTIMINQQNLRNTFQTLFSSKHTAYLLLVAKTKFPVSLRRCTQTTHCQNPHEL